MYPDENWVYTQKQLGNSYIYPNKKVKTGYIATQIRTGYPNENYPNVRFVGCIILTLIAVYECSTPLSFTVELPEFSGHTIILFLHSSHEFLILSYHISTHLSFILSYTEMHFLHSFPLHSVIFSFCPPAPYSSLLLHS